MSLELASVVREVALKAFVNEYPFIIDIELKPMMVNGEPVDSYYLEVKIDKKKLGEFVGKEPNNNSLHITNVLTDFVVVDPHEQEFVDVYYISSSIKRKLDQLLKMFDIDTGGPFMDSVLFVF